MMDVIGKLLEEVSTREGILTRVEARLQPGSSRKVLKEKGLAFRMYFDLAVSYFIPVDMEGAMMSVRITDELLEERGLTEQEVYDAAINRDIYEIVKLEDMLSELTGSSLYTGMPMYVATNRRRFHGASAMLNRRVLAEAERYLGRKYYILPSSVHEVLFVKTEDGYESALQDMVMEINMTELSEKDRLSDSIYTYDSGTVTMSRKGMIWDFRKEK